MPSWLSDPQPWALIAAIAGALLAVGTLIVKVVRAIRSTIRTIARLGDELLGDHAKGIPSVRAALNDHTADGHGGVTRAPRPAGPWAPRTYPPGPR